jgi:DnaJ family protein C protein 28
MARREWRQKRMPPNEHSQEAGNIPQPSDDQGLSRADKRALQYRWQLEQARRRAVRDIVEQRIEEARAEGKFDHLGGEGKPLPRDDSEVWAGERALAFHLLKSNDAAPPEVERGREIDRELERAEEMLRALRHQRDTLAARRAVYASDRRAYNIQRDATERRYEAALRAINSNILSLNIIAPAALHRRMIPIQQRMDAFRDEFPHLPE